MKLSILIYICLKLSCIQSPRTINRVLSTNLIRSIVASTLQATSDLMGNNPSSQQPDEYRCSESEKSRHGDRAVSAEKEKNMKGHRLAEKPGYEIYKKKGASRGWAADIKDPAFAGALGDVKQPTLAERKPKPTSAPAPAPTRNEPTEAEKAAAPIRHLHFWRDGFQVRIPPEHNGGQEFVGEVLRYENPDACRVLDELNNGYVFF